jgi:hypothetical protein
MSSIKRSNNLAARMGRWSAHHRKIASSAGSHSSFIAVLIGKAAGTVELTQNDAIPGEFGRAPRLIDAVACRGNRRVRANAHLQEFLRAL